MSDRVAADNSYIEEWSPALHDLAILVRTVPLVFGTRRPQAVNFTASALFGGRKVRHR